MASFYDYYYFENQVSKLEKISLFLVKDDVLYIHDIDKFIKKCKKLYQGMNIYIYQIEKITFNKDDFVCDFTYNINSHLNEVDKSFIHYKNIKKLEDSRRAKLINYIFALLYDTLDDLEQTCWHGGLI